MGQRLTSRYALEFPAHTISPCFLQLVAVKNSLLLNHSFGPCNSVQKYLTKTHRNGNWAASWSPVKCRAQQGKRSELGITPGAVFGPPCTQVAPFCSSGLPFLALCSVGNSATPVVLALPLFRWLLVLASHSFLFYELPSMSLSLSLAFPSPAPP